MQENVNKDATKELGDRIMEDKLTVTDEALTEFNILREKIEVVLDCAIDNMNAREQTLTYIAIDYLAGMGEMIQTIRCANP